MFTPIAHALRSLNRSRAFAAIAVGTLGAALGIAITVMALVNGVIHPREPFHEADRLFTVWSRGDGSDRRVTGAQRISAIRSSVAAIGGIALRAPDRVPVETGTWARDAMVDRVSPDFFTLLGATATRGRFFTVATAESDAAAVVVSYSFWRSALGGRAIPGERILVGARRYEVIGVAPFEVESGLSATLWLADARATEVANGTGAVVRLRPGATIGALQSQLVGASRRLSATYGVGRFPFGFEVRRLRPDPLELQESHRALLVAALAIFLIACANLASLLLARGEARKTEAAVRLALGARRRDVIRLALTECLIVSLAGAAVGLGVAYALIGLVQGTLPPTVPYFGTLIATFDWRVWTFALVAAVGAALLIGVAPAFRAAEVDLSAPLKTSSAGTVGRAHGRYSALVIAEVTLALALVSGAGLLARASFRLQHADPGFARDELVEAWIVPRRWRDTSTHVPPGFFDEVAAQVASLPGVTSSAWTSTEGTDGWMVTAAVTGEGSRETYLRSVSVVSSGYLKTMGISVAQGRDFEPGDAVSGAVILSSRAARELWYGAPPVGDRLALGTLRRSRAWLPVVGVTRAGPESGSAFDYYDSGDPEVYVMRPPSPVARTIIVRTSAERVPRVALAVTQLLNVAVPEGMSRSVAPLRETHDRIAEAHRFLSRVFLGLAAFALLLAVVGLYSVLSYAAVRRTREFAVRMAIGASARDVARHVVHDGAVMILAGTAVGAFLAMWASQLVDPFLFDLYRINAATLVAAEGVVGAATGAACVLVAWHAARIDPVKMLRSI